MKKKSILLLEIIIWILILGGLISLGVNNAIHQLSSHKRYQIVFKDVDNLIVGAPVRVMGIQVGHITEVKPADDQVYVTFVITDDNVIIPVGSNATIQFTGIAGSKSLEVEPPILPVKSGAYFKITEPVRINSLMGLQTDISKTILDTCNNVLNFFGTSSVDEIKAGIKLSTHSSKDSVKVFEDAATAARSTNKLLISGTNFTKKFLNEQNNTMDVFYKSMGPSYDKDTKQACTSLKLLTGDITKSFESNIVHNFSKEMVDNIKSFDRNTHTFSQQVNRLKANAPGLIENSDNSMNLSIGGLNDLINNLGNNIAPDKIRYLDQNSKALKDYTEYLNKKL